MWPRRLVLVALVAALLPAAARAAVPVALYPLRLAGLSKDERADVHALVQAGIASGARRGVLRPRAPLLVRAGCGEEPTPRCLARVAEDGVVLAGRGERRGGTVVLAAALWDRNGQRTREVHFVLDLVIENLRPLNDALAQLESELDLDGTVAGAPRTLPPEPVTPQKPMAAAPKPDAALLATPKIAAVPLPPPPAALRNAKGTTAARTAATETPTATATKTPTAAKTAASETPTATATKTPSTSTTTSTTTTTSAAASPRSPSPIDLSAPEEPPVWKRQAGPFFTIVGGALLASGAAVAVANRSLANDLAAKRTAGTLGASDRASFDRVDRYNVLSTVLLAGGGVSLAAGTWIWITAPARPGDPALAVAGGRF